MSWDYLVRAGFNLLLLAAVAGLYAVARRSP